jgi:hypothetical protein
MKRSVPDTQSVSVRFMTASVIVRNLLFILVLGILYTATAAAADIWLS